MLASHYSEGDKVEGIGKTVIAKMSLQESMIEYLILIFFQLYHFIKNDMLKVSINSEYGKGLKELVNHLGRWL